MSYSIHDLTSVLGIRSLAIHPARVSYLLTDSRKLTSPAETLFFALTTKNNDAHLFIDELYDAGVRNFVVSKMLPQWRAFSDANFLKVNDTLLALQKVAAHHRSRFNIPVIGITGSNGKTVVKEWLYQLLGGDFNITRSPRSYNSQIGVPLSVWELGETTELGIFEAGISQPDEMEHLEPIINPTIGVLTKIGEAHQKNFTSLQQKCMEKLELFVNCKVLVYDEDNELVTNCVDRMVMSQKAFSWSRKNREAHLYISNIEKKETTTRIAYSFLKFEYDFEIPFTDDASIENAINCLAVALYLHVAPKDLSKRMKMLEPVAMRLDVRQGKNGCLLINDSYNSDVNSVKIALDFQQQRKMERPLKKTVILSDILQSGVSPSSLYKKVAHMMEQSGIQKFIGIGRDIKAHEDLFGAPEKSFFETTDEFIQSGNWKTFKDELILLKGARLFHFEQIGALLEERVHETVLEVDLDALVHNFNFYKSRLNPHVKLTCMVKANAYGAGAVEIAKTLQYHRCDYLAVAVSEEGVMLRKEGVTMPIIVLNPEVNGFDELYTYNLEPEIYNFRILQAFIKEGERRAITGYPVHIKIDTGMHRLGFLPEEVTRVASLLKSQKALKATSVFSHLSASESWVFDEFTHHQMDVFNQTAQEIEQALGGRIHRHILNSAGIERFPKDQYDLVRLGIGLYGISPSGLEGLRNVFTLKTTILQIKKVDANGTVGYGRKEKLARDARVATIRFGYADGLNRQFGNRVGEVLINGHLAPIIGNVCMDLCMVDVTDIPAQEGDTAVLMGENLPVVALAERIGTIPYEILTAISHRVKRVYIKE